MAENESAHFTAWDSEAGWRESTTLFGTPGGEDPPPTPLPSLTVAGLRSVKITGAPGSVWSVERSTDLAEWINVASVTIGDEGSETYTDSSPPEGPALFYRCARP